MSDDTGGAARPDPPAANQSKDEPIARTADEPVEASDQPVQSTPGDSNGVPVPSTHAAEGTSETGVALPGVVAPGKPDGEVDTRA